MAIRYYRALMSLDPDGSYGVVFPELPGCVSHGNDLNDALRMATEALGIHVTAMIEDGDPVPPAVPIDAPLPEWVVEAAGDRGIDWSGDVRVLVPVDAPCSVPAKAASWPDADGRYPGSPWPPPEGYLAERPTRSGRGART